MLWAQVETGMELDAQAGRLLDDQELNRRYRQLQEVGAFPLAGNSSAMSFGAAWACDVTAADYCSLTCCDQSVGLTAAGSGASASCRAVAASH